MTKLEKLAWEATTEFLDGIRRRGSFPHPHVKVIVTPEWVKENWPLDPDRIDGLTNFRDGFEVGFLVCRELIANHAQDQYRNYSALEGDGNLQRAVVLSQFHDWLLQLGESLE